MSHRILYWSPRILCVLFAAFLAIFALDVFEEPMSAGERAVALALHLLPSALVLLVLWVAWRREWIASVLFLALAVYHVTVKWGVFRWDVYAVVDGPLVAMTILFWLNWRARRRASAPSADGVESRA